MTSRVFVVRRSPLARPLTAVVAAVLVTSALAGCTALSLDGGCAVLPGDASRTVSASGDVGTSPAVEFPTPLLADTPEASVLTDGDGPDLETGSIVFANVTYFDASTGDSIGETSGFFRVGPAGLAEGEALDCVTLGSRVAVVGTAVELSANQNLLEAAGEDTMLVGVIDTVQALLGKANGINQLPQDGMPTVVTAVDGTPGISSTYVPAADEPRTATIKAGGGAVVEETDTVVLHARSWNWSGGSTGTVTLGEVDTWRAGVPASIEPTVEALLGEQSLVDAIVGSKVGSQILIVIPNADDPTQATVYVFDVLGILATE
jgi:peptidylprolyl isomerase